MMLSSLMIYWVQWRSHCLSSRLGYHTINGRLQNLGVTRVVVLISFLNQAQAFPPHAHAREREGGATRRREGRAVRQRSANQVHRIKASHGPARAQPLHRRTVREGYNMGRKYFLRAETREDIEAIARELTMGVEEAKRRADKRTWFEKSQARVKALYDSSI
jgi:hypothetical protein